MTRKFRDSEQTDPEQTDVELLRRYISGEDAALAMLSERYSKPLKRIVESYLDPRVARRVSESDIVQETWIVAVRKLRDRPQLPEIAIFPWLREIARERVVDAHRMHRGVSKRNVYREKYLAATDASVSQLMSLLPARECSPSQNAVKNESTQKIRETLDLLDSKAREIIVLRFIERHDMRRCAEILGLSLEAAKSRQRRALASFAKLYRQSQ